MKTLRSKSGKLLINYYSYGEARIVAADEAWRLNPNTAVRELWVDTTDLVRGVITPVPDPWDKVEPMKPAPVPHEHELREAIAMAAVDHVRGKLMAVVEDL